MSGQEAGIASINVLLHPELVSGHLRLFIEAGKRLVATGHGTDSGDDDLSLSPHRPATNASRHPRWPRTYIPSWRPVPPSAMEPWPTRTMTGSRRQLSDADLEPNRSSFPDPLLPTPRRRHAGTKPRLHHCGTASRRRRPRAFARACMRQPPSQCVRI